MTQNIDITKRSEKLREKVWKIMDYIQTSYYVSNSNISIDGHETNDTILLLTLTALADGKALIIGNYGIGKTTASEAILSILYALPVEVYQAAKLNGHPEQTEEKMIGRPDLGALNKGEEKVIWSLFTQVTGKIIDEINRLPEGKQTELLDSVDRRLFKYLNQVLFQDYQPFYATANYPDRGNTPLIPPLLDRFDIIVEAKRSPFAAAIALDEEIEENKRKISDTELAEKVINIFLSNISYKEKLEKIEKIREEFYDKRKDIVFSPDELKMIREEIRKIKFSEEAKMFLNFFNLSLYNPYTGENRPGELNPEENHYKNYLPGKIKNAISQRFFNSVVKYARALAWLRGKEEVSLEEILIVMPYALAHRAEFDESYLQDINTKRNDINNYNKSMINLFASEELIKSVHNEYKELREKMLEAFKYAREGNVNKLKELSEKYDHPFFKGLYASMLINKTW